MASASDNFDRADGDIGANWTVEAGNFDISSNLCVERTVTGGYYSAWYDATAPATNNFSSQAVCLSPTGGLLATGTTVRQTAGAVTFYGYAFFGGDRFS